MKMFFFQKKVVCVNIDGGDMKVLNINKHRMCLKILIFGKKK